jgi:hypothetical protein
MDWRTEALRKAGIKAEPFPAVPWCVATHRPAALGGSDGVAVGTHGHSVSQRTEQGKPQVLGRGCNHSEHTAAVMCGAELTQA